MAVTTTDVQNDPIGRREFLGLPAVVYAGDSRYLPPRSGKVEADLDRPCFRDRQMVLLAKCQGEPRARAVARVSPVLRDGTGRPMGLIGFFEALDDPDSADDLLKSAVAWLRERGAGQIVGPMDGDTWHRYRFNVGPFERPPFLMEPYNPPYYARLWEQGGFRVLARYYSKHVADARDAAAALHGAYARSIEKGLSYRKLRMNDLASELRLVYRLSCKIFAGNLYYSEISEADFLALYEGTQALLEPRLLWFALDSGGDPVGFVFSIPDYFQSVASMRGGTGLLAKLRFKLKQRSADTLNLKTLGVLPEYQGRGLGPALMHHTLRGGCELGLSKANLCLIHEDNASGRLDGGRGDVFRWYHLYEYAGE